MTNISQAKASLAGCAMARCTQEVLSRGDRFFTISTFHFSKGEPMTEITETRKVSVTCCRQGCPDSETEERFVSPRTYHTVRSKKVHNWK